MRNEASERSREALRNDELAAGFALAGADDCARPRVTPRGAP